MASQPKSGRSFEEVVRQRRSIRGFQDRDVPDRVITEILEVTRLAPSSMEALDFPLMILGKGHFVNPYKKTNPMVVALARLYYPLARYRVTNFETRWPIESRLVKSMGLFGRRPHLLRPPRSNCATLLRLH